VSEVSTHLHTAISFTCPGVLHTLMINKTPLVWQFWTLHYRA